MIKLNKTIDFLKSKGGDNFYIDAQNIYVLNIDAANTMPYIYHINIFGGGGAVWDNVQAKALMISSEIPKETFFFDAAAEVVKERHINYFYLRRLRAEKIPLIFEPKNKMQADVLFCLSRELANNGEIEAVVNIENILCGGDGSNVYQYLLDTDNFAVIAKTDEADILIHTYQNTIKVVPYLPHNTNVLRPFFIK